MNDELTKGPSAPDPYKEPITSDAAAPSVQPAPAQSMPMKPTERPADMSRPKMYGDTAAKSIERSESQGTNEPKFLEEHPFMGELPKMVGETPAGEPKKDAMKNVAGALHETNTAYIAEQLKEKTAISLQKAAEEALKPKPEGLHAADFLHKDDMPIKPLRTFQGDIAEVMEHQKSSAISIKMAKQEKEPPPPPEERVERATASVGIKAVSLVLSALLVLVGLTVFIVFQYFTEISKPNNAPLFGTAIPYDSHRDMDVSSARREDMIEMFLDERTSQPAEKETVRYLRLVESGPAGLREIDIAKFLNIVGSRPPQTLLRAFDGGVMAGTYSTGKMEPFILIKVASFDNAYGGMLEWEESAALELAPLFTTKTVEPAEEVRVSVSPAANASNTPVYQEKVRRSSFKDLVVRNIDTRALRSVDGEVVMLYSFIDKQTLLITSNETAFRGLVDKYIASKLAR